MLYKRLGVWIRLSLMAFAMSFLAAPAQAWFFGDDHPDQAEITRAVQKDLPQWIKIIDLDIGSQETRSGLMEHSESRVKVSMAPTEALYRISPKKTGRPSIGSHRKLTSEWRAF